MAVALTGLYGIYVYNHSMTLCSFVFLVTLIRFLFSEKLEEAAQKKKEQEKVKVAAATPVKKA